MNIGTHLRDILRNRRRVLRSNKVVSRPDMGLLFQGQVPGDDREAPDRPLLFTVDSAALRRECMKVRETQHQRLTQRRSLMIAWTVPFLASGWLLSWTGVSIGARQAFMLGLGAQQAGRAIALTITRLRRMFTGRRWSANPLAASVRFWGGYGSLPAVWAVNFERMRGCTLDESLAVNIDEVRESYYRWAARQFGSNCEDARRTLASLGAEYYGTLGELAQTVRLLFAEN